MAITHLDLAIASRTLVRASRPPPGFPAVLAVSNLDLVLGPFPIFFVSVYAAPAAGLDAVVSAVRAALPSYLSSFFPFAGRVVRDADSRIPAVACNNAGAELVVADAAAPLGDLDFAEVDRSLGLIRVPFDDGLALSVQLVRFACGGFALTIATTHLLVDGRGLAMLMSALAETVREGGLSRAPVFDRSLFRPRTPPRYAASLDAEFARFAPGTMINPLLAAAMRRRLYRVAAPDLAALQAEAAPPGGPVSRFVALCAHVWKLLARAVGDSDPCCRMAWIVDGRKAVEPSAGALDWYVGNVVTYTSREARVGDLLRAPLRDVADMVRAGIAPAMTRARFQELADWMEERKSGVQGRRQVDRGCEPRAREPGAGHFGAAPVRHRRGPRVREAQARHAVAAARPAGLRVRDGRAQPEWRRVVVRRRHEVVAAAHGHGGVRPWEHAEAGDGGEPRAGDAGGVASVTWGVFCVHVSRCVY
jgi:hypothetical protein